MKTHFTYETFEHLEKISLFPTRRPGKNSLFQNMPIHSTHNNSINSLADKTLTFLLLEPTLFMLFDAQSFIYVDYESAPLRLINLLDLINRADHPTDEMIKQISPRLGQFHSSE